MFNLVIYVLSVGIYCVTNSVKKKNNKQNTYTRMAHKKQIYTKSSDIVPYRYNVREESQKKEQRTRILGVKRKLDPEQRKALNSQTRRAREYQTRHNKPFDTELSASSDQQPDLSNIDIIYQDIDELVEEEGTPNLPLTTDEEANLCIELGELIKTRTASRRVGSYTHVAVRSGSPSIGSVKTWAHPEHDKSKVIDFESIVNAHSPFCTLQTPHEVEKGLTSGKLPSANNIHMELQPILLLGDEYEDLTLDAWNSKLLSLGGETPQVLDIKESRGNGLLVLLHKITKDMKVCTTLQASTRRKDRYRLVNYTFIAAPVNTTEDIVLVEYPDFSRD